MRQLLTLMAVSLLLACGGGRSADSADFRADEGQDGPNGRTPTAGASSRAAIAGVQCSGAECLEIGGFTPTFEEPVIYDRADSDSNLGNDLPLDNPLRQVPRNDNCVLDEDGRPVNCKPGAGTINLLANDDMLFFSALEGTESAEFSIVTEGGQALINEQTRLLSTRNGEAVWTLPTPLDGGADDAEVTCLLPGCALNTDADDPRRNSGSLFCADVNALADGRILAVGGTNYYSEPGISTPFNIGVVELEGLNAARTYNPSTNEWIQVGDMNFGRWYPTLVSLASGDQFVASGVTKLLKPVYPNEPLQSGRNVVQTETYDLGCGTWSDNGGPGQRSLPLYPRLHLLPNGQVYYAGSGQAFNPFGQAYDQALWNIVGAYSPETGAWTDLGYAGLPLRLNEAGVGALTQALNATNDQNAGALQSVVTGLVANAANTGAVFDPLVEGLSGDPLNAIQNAIYGGFRGSTTSIMLPLQPDPETGSYGEAEFLIAGGVLGGVTASSPGGYLGIAASRIDTVEIDGESMQYSSRLTGPLAQGRWYGQGVLLPTGEVMMFSGASADEVAAPGSAFPRLVSEIFDPVSETWRPMATQNNARTYHNTAILLPDGRVMVGGHAPIDTGYAYSIDLTGLGLSPNFGRDPSFEIYSPPYMFMNRPQLSAAPAQAGIGQQFNISTPDAGRIDEVVLVRRATLTHLVDADQRNVVLPITGRSGGSISVRMPNAQAVLPPGDYMLFVVSQSEQGRVPSRSLPLRVTGANTVCEL